jgi:hypothetical protein
MCNLEHPCQLWVIPTAERKLRVDKVVSSKFTWKCWNTYLFSRIFGLSYIFKDDEHGVPVHWSEEDRQQLQWAVFTPFSTDMHKQIHFEQKISEHPRWVVGCSHMAAHTLMQKVVWHSQIAIVFRRKKPIVVDGDLHVLEAGPFQELKHRDSGRPWHGGLGTNRAVSHERQLKSNDIGENRPVEIAGGVPRVIGSRSGAPARHQGPPLSILGPWR